MPGTETTMALRQETQGNEGWERSARAGNPNKYFGVSVDCHANEPKGWARRQPTARPFWAQATSSHQLPHLPRGAPPAEAAGR